MDAFFQEWWCWWKMCGMENLNLIWIIIILGGKNKKEDFLRLHAESIESFLFKWMKSRKWRWIKIIAIHKIAPEFENSSFPLNFASRQHVNLKVDSIEKIWIEMFSQYATKAMTMSWGWWVPCQTMRHESEMSFKLSRSHLQPTEVLSGRNLIDVFFFSLTAAANRIYFFPP